MELVVTVSRGDVDVVNYDPDFMKRLEAAMDSESGTGLPTPRSDGYMKFIRAQRDLRWAIEQILPTETEAPYTVIIRVEGQADHSTGPRLY